MGWMQFVSDLVGDVLSWPVAAVGIVVLFRQEIVTLLGRLRKVSGSWGEAEFDKELENSDRQLSSVRMAAGTATVTVTASGEASRGSDEFKPSAAETDRLQQLSDASTVDPEGVILRAWDRLERDLIAWMTSSDKGMGVTEYGVIPKAAPAPLLKAFRSLRRIRNEVAHEAAEPTRSQALDFRLQVEWLRAGLASWYGVKPPEDS